MVSKIPAADRIPKRARELAKEWAELYRMNLIEQVEKATKAIEHEYFDSEGKPLKLDPKEVLGREERRAIAEAAAHECAFQKTVGEVAIRFASQEMDFALVKMNAEVVARRYDDVVDQRLIPSAAAKKILEQWDAFVAIPGGYRDIFPEHERSERKRRLEAYISMMETLETKYDHGKIEPQPTQEAKQ